MICDRCKNEADVTTMSMFNTQEICLECKRAELKHTEYKKANDKVREEENKGNRNYEGIGLPLDLVKEANSRRNKDNKYEYFEIFATEDNEFGVRKFVKTKLDYYTLYDLAKEYIENNQETYSMKSFIDYLKDLGYDAELKRNENEVLDLDSIFEDIMDEEK